MMLKTVLKSDKIPIMQIPKRKPGKFTHLKNDPVMTREKFSELENELRRLKDKVRPALAAEVSRLAELGDFSENAEYQLAKGKLRGINNAILKLEVQIRDAVLIEKKKNGIVEIGSVVTIERSGKKKIYEILGSSETNPERGVISYSSPLGAALVGKEVGETIELSINNNLVSYQIISIN